MNIDRAHAETKRLFAAFGSMKPPEVISEFARVLVEARCEACALEAVTDMRETGSKAPGSIAALRGAILDRTSSVAHYPHLSESTRESIAGKAEGWWRSEGTATVRSVLHCDRLHAEHIAARIWYLGVCPPDVDALRVECQADVWEGWNVRWNVTPELVAHNWDMGRRNAVKSVAIPPLSHGYSDAEWGQWCDEETNLLSGVLP